MVLSNKRRAEIIDLFGDLPEGKSHRNKYSFTEAQIMAIVELREHRLTPIEIEKMLNISVYIIHRLWNRGKKIIQDREVARAAMARVELEPVPWS